MARAAILAVLGVLALAGGANAQDAEIRKQALAVRVPNGLIRVDGRLDEQEWRQLTALGDFTQKEPAEGAAPTDPTEIFFAYDDTALYIGARMHSRNPSSIQAPLGRRDSVDQSDYISVYLDTFLDHRTAYNFGVNASGVRLDRFYPNDSESNADNSYEPVWEAAASRSADGWTAEMWIPFSQLRFNELAEQVWGLNVMRFSPANNEKDYWVATPQTDARLASRFGELRGIRSIPASRRIELLPYITGSSTLNGLRNLANPFDDGKNLEGRFGADVKMGLGPNFTLNLTVNPDFGQIDADPAEVNLSIVETALAERRPFFTENSRMFIVGANNYFYPRRIGAPPPGPASGDFVDRPDTSTIAMAAKLTGRLPSKLSIAVLGAVTNEEQAKTSKAGLISRVRVAPRTTYTLARLQQQFGTSASVFGGVVSAVHRAMTPGEPLEAQLVRSAYSAAGDATIRFKNGEYVLGLVAGGTIVEGSAAAIERVQRSTLRLLHRPDRERVWFDPTQTRLKGYSFTMDFDRVSGRHWLFNTNWKTDSPTFEPSNMGRSNGVDSSDTSVDVRYRETTPGKYFRAYSISLSHQNQMNLDLQRQGGSVRHGLNLTFKNFWTANYSLTRQFRSLDSFLTRGGPRMARPAGWTLSTTVSSSNAASVQWSINASATARAEGGMSRHLSSSTTLRPGPRWRLEITPSYDRSIETQQYVATLPGGRALTYGNRYAFAHIERSTFVTEFRLGYTLKPDVNLDVYAEPFAASGRYYDYGELLQPNDSQMLLYGVHGGTSMVLDDAGNRTIRDGANSFTLSNRDFNARSFRSNVVLRWEYRPGSTLYVVWQQNRSDTLATGNRVGVADLFDSLTSPGANVFAIKTLFWIPIK